MERGGYDYAACHSRVMVSKVDPKGRRLFNKSVGIGPYRIDWLDMTHAGDSLVLKNAGSCSITYLDGDGNIIRKVDLPVIAS